MGRLHIDEIELFYEPRDNVSQILEGGGIEGEPEMTPFESAFLCGVIKSQKPEKIVEVGIAGGGTTAIILQCIHMLELERCEMLSVDYSERFYQNKALFSGHLGAKALELMPELKERHKFLLGNVACSWSEDIKGCDMLILDTVHSLPGELLDIITLLPLLKDGAVVVLHDISLNHYNAKDCIATGVLFSNIVGEKYINLDYDKDSKYPNIGAFVIGEETRANISNMFEALIQSWRYYPDAKQVKTYRDAMCKYYDKDMLALFDMALMLNKKTAYKQSENLWYVFPCNLVPQGSNIVLYGAGTAGNNYKLMVDKLNYCNIVGWVDSSYEQLGISEVTSPENIPSMDYDYVVIATSNKTYVNEIRTKLLELGVKESKIITQNVRI